MKQLTQSNYAKGFLIDDELMAGVTEHPENPSVFVTFILEHQTGNYLHYQAFEKLNQALESLNQIPRPWTYERIGGCSENGCEKACVSPCSAHPSLTKP